MCSDRPAGVAPLVPSWPVSLAASVRGQGGPSSFLSCTCAVILGARGPGVHTHSHSRFLLFSPIPIQTHTRSEMHTHRCITQVTHSPLHLYATHGHSHPYIQEQAPVHVYTGTYTCTHPDTHSRSCTQSHLIHAPHTRHTCVYVQRQTYRCTVDTQTCPLTQVRTHSLPDTRADKPGAATVVRGPH